MCIRDRDVPQELYEAMDVDGGNSLHKLAFITLPMISPSTMFCGIVRFVTAIQCFVPVSYTHLDVYKRQQPPQV